MLVKMHTWKMGLAHKTSTLHGTCSVVIYMYNIGIHEVITLFPIAKCTLALSFSEARCQLHVTGMGIVLMVYVLL